MATTATHLSAYYQALAQIIENQARLERLQKATLGLVQQMHDEQKKIKESAKQLNDIAQVINIITDAVTVGTALAAKAG
jgi:SAM-dependent MidA family methyltransferase